MTDRKLDPKDFQFVKVRCNSRIALHSLALQVKDAKLVKNPGEINGIDFTIDSLENCDVFLLDYSAQVRQARRIHAILHCRCKSTIARTAAL